MFFHAGDGNLHPLILYDAALPGQLEAAEALGARSWSCASRSAADQPASTDSTREDQPDVRAVHTTAEIETFAALKAAFDPAGLLNPGKAIPTLARCAEFGAMHVHKGALPFPHLERILSAEKKA